MSESYKEIFKELDDLKKRESKCFRLLNKLYHEHKKIIWEEFEKTYPDWGLGCIPNDEAIISYPPDGGEIVVKLPCTVSGTIITHHSPGGFFSEIKKFDAEATVEEIRDYIRNELPNEM